MQFESREMIMGSKYVDLVIGIFMAIFAYTRFTNGQMGFGILFLVLFIANMIVFVMKHRNQIPEKKK